MSKYFLLVVVLLLASCAPKSASAESQPTSPTSVKTSLNTRDPTAAAAPLHEVEVGVIVVNTLNVREGPGVNFPVVGSLNQGEKFYILGETVNGTGNRWLLISLSDSSFGWVTGDRSYITTQKEMVDFNAYSSWQKNVEAAKSAALIPVTSP